MKFGLYSDKMTLAEIGKKYKVTPQRIRAIEKRALEKLKEAADRRGITFESLIDTDLVPHSQEGAPTDPGNSTE